MLVQRNKPFELLDITLDYEETKAILVRLQVQPGTFEQFTIMLQLRHKLAEFVSKVEEERDQCSDTKQKGEGNG